MNKNILIASILAVLASPLALARGHTQDIYGGVDLGIATQDEQTAFCNSMAATNSTATDPADNNDATITLNVATSGGTCEDAETALRLFAGYKISDMISVEGFWLSSSGYASNQTVAFTIEGPSGSTYATRADITVSGITSETDYSSFGLAATGKYEVYDNLNIKGVVGLHSYSIESSFTPPSTGAPTGNNASVMGGHLDRVAAAREDSGVGILYGIGAEYTLGGNFNIRAGYDVLSSGDDSVSYMSAGASYTYSF